MKLIDGAFQAQNDDHDFHLSVIPAQRMVGADAAVKIRYHRLPGMVTTARLITNPRGHWHAPSCLSHADDGPSIRHTHVVNSQG